MKGVRGRGREAHILLSYSDRSLSEDHMLIKYLWILMHQSVKSGNILFYKKNLKRLLDAVDFYLDENCSHTVKVQIRGRSLFPARTVQMPVVTFPWLHLHTKRRVVGKKAEDT